MMSNEHPMGAQPKIAVSRRTLNVIFAGLVILLLAGSVFLFKGFSGLYASSGASDQATTLQGTSLNGVPAPDFTLTDQNGATVALKQLRGRPVVLTFLDSVCPHSDCSLMAQYLTWSGQFLGAKQSAQVSWVAVSLNPWHDTPATATAFLTSRQVSRPMR